MNEYWVGWRAYRVVKGQPIIIAIGKDHFVAMDQNRAMEVAVRRVPELIHAPADTQIAIRWVNEREL